jgi:hypothetical protein
VEATDPDGDTLTYSLPVAPTGMTIDPASGLIQWTPAVDQVGSHTVTVRATDQGGLFIEQSFNVVVTAVSQVYCAPPSAVPPTSSSFFTDGAPLLTITGDQALLLKELGGYGNYGRADGASNILYSGQAATWHFSLPRSIDKSRIAQIFFRVAIIADDHYYVPLSDYTYSVWINGYPRVSKCPANLPHGQPYGTIFNNWTTREFDVPLGGIDHQISIENTSAISSGHWIAVDWIELHVLLVSPPPNLTAINLVKSIFFSVACDD